MAKCDNCGTTTKDGIRPDPSKDICVECDESVRPHWGRPTIMTTHTAVRQKKRSREVPHGVM
jgi:hypothetical protein